MATPQLKIAANWIEPVYTEVDIVRASESMSSFSGTSKSSSLAVGSGLESLCLTLVDVGLGAVIFLAPLFMGGRHPLGYLVYAGLAFGTLAAWLARQALGASGRWKLSSADGLIAAAIMLVGLQIIPLPPTLLDSVSPAIKNHLPLWTSSQESAVKLGQWSTISLNPAATRGGFVMLLSYAALFVVVVQRIQERRDAERFMKWIAISAAAMALLGLIQFFFGNGDYLWIYKNPERTTFGAVKGVFFNENHMGHFLALGVGPLLWWIATLPNRSDAAAKFGSFTAVRQGKNDTVRLLLAAGLIIVAVSALFTFSRGGLIAAFLSGAICIGLFALRGILGRRSLIGLAAMGVIVAGAISIYGHETLLWQLETLTSGSLEKLDANEARRRIWAADTKVVADYTLAGSGVGTHAEIYKQYFPDYSASEYVYAECSYLHTLVETGVIGTVVLLAGLALAVAWCWRAIRAERTAYQSLGIAALGSLLGSCAHALFDFAWYVPACLSMLSVQLACVVGMLQSRSRDKNGSDTTTAIHSGLPIPRWGWGVATAVVLVAGLFSVNNRLAPALASADWERASTSIKKLIRSGVSPVDAPSEELVPIVDGLERVLSRDSTNSRAHLEMAMMCMAILHKRQRESDNPMELIHIRDAALKSQFASKSQQDAWLDAVLGESRGWLDKALFHARRTVELCPLHGEAYTCLAQLAFVEGADVASNTALIDQALRVRPYNGEVLIVAGAEAAFANDRETQLKYWKEAFVKDPRVQQHLVRLLGPVMSARDFISDLSLNLPAARTLFDFYRRSGRPEDANQVAMELIHLNQEAIKSAKPRVAAELWSEAQSVYWAIGERARAIECARQAVQCAPEQFRWHRELASRLADVGEFSEAIEELKWCLRRAPDDSELQNQLLQMTRRNMTESSPTAQSAPPTGRSRRR